MHSLSTILALLPLALHATAAPAPAPSDTPTPTTTSSFIPHASTTAIPPPNPAFCAPASDCAQINLDNALPETISDIGAFLERSQHYCTAVGTFCWIDVATSGSCQVSIGWSATSLENMKGHSVSRQEIKDKSAPYITGGPCVENGVRKGVGGVDTSVNSYGNWFIGVKAVGYDLF